MATITTTIRLIDSVSSTMTAITRRTDTLIRSFERLNQVSRTAIQSPVTRQSTGMQNTIRQVERMENNIRRSNIRITELQHNFQRATAVITDMQGQLSRTVQKITQLQQNFQAANNTIAQLTARIESLERRINGANNNQRNLNSSIREGTSAAGGLLNKFKSIAAAYIGLRAIGKGIQIADDYTNQNARLALINDGLQTQVQLQNKIYQAAQASRGAYGNIAGTIGKLGLLAGNAFANNSELIYFTETMQKAFKVSGASTSEASNAMYQLTQAMASGRLQGDEFRSIIENAPMLANAIATYTGVGMEGLKELSSEGVISAEIIKNSLFQASEEINRKFNQMPITFSDVWNQISNTAIMTFRRTIENVSGFLNSNTAQALIQGIITSIQVLSTVIEGVIGMTMWVSNIFVDNWSVIAPIIMGIVAIMGVYLAVTKGVILLQTIGTGVSSLFHTAQTFLSIGFSVLTGSTAASSAAIFQFNSALLACPLTWIVIAIIAVIAVIYAVVAAINKFKNTSISATGIIAGVFATVGAAIANTVIGVVNFVIGIGIDLYNLIVSFANFIGNVFQHPLKSIAHGFFDLLDVIAGVARSAASIIDTLLGSNLSGALLGLQDNIQNFVDSKIGAYEIEVATKINKEDYLLDRVQYKTAWNTGYQIGQGIDDKIGGLFNFNSNGIGGLDRNNFGGDVASMVNDMANTADNTGKMADSMEESDEDLKYLRELAERESINRFTTAEIKVDMTNHNNISNGMDADGLITQLKEGLFEAMYTVAEGV